MPKNQKIKNLLLWFLDIVDKKLLIIFGIKWTIWWPKILKKWENWRPIFADFPIQIAENTEKRPNFDIDDPYLSNRCELKGK